MKIGFISLGCSKNLVDSEKMMGMLSKGGHVLVNRPQDAEAIIVNTCGFIDPAKKEGIDTILEMAEYKKMHLKKLIVVGCLAQRYLEDLKAELPEVDRFIPISDYQNLDTILYEELGNPLTSFAKSERLLTSKPWLAYLKIAEGCSNHCTYCAIPLIRGDNVSRDFEDIISEAKSLAAGGVKELVLIAQDTTKYGIDTYGENRLYELLMRINEIKELHWIRVLYMYPDEIDERLIKTMASLDKVIPYFDIPLQHCNDKLLKAMNRRGSKADVLATIDLIRKTFKQPVLRTTFIVGFPHETQEQFEELMAFTKDVCWDSMGAFTYSAEEDTPAAEMDDQLSEKAKNVRLEQLMRLQKQISLTKNKELIGTTLEVLVESYDALSRQYRGRSIYNAPDDVDGMVIFKSEQELKLGTFVDVVISEALPYDLIGIVK